MGLNWRVTEVKDYEALWVKGTNQWTGEEEDILNAKTEALIWFTMVAGLYSQIKEDTAAEWYARIRLYERVNGVYCQRMAEDGSIEDDPFTPEDIERNIGLWTNGCFKKEAWSTYVNRITKRFAEDNRRAYGLAVQKEDVA